MSKKPIAPPQPRQINKPLAQPKSRTHRPLFEALMKRIVGIIEGSEGKLTRASLARDIGKGPTEVSEWIRGDRSTPLSETTLMLRDWADSHDKKGAMEHIRNLKKN